MSENLNNATLGDRIMGHEQSISIEAVPVVGTEIVVGLMMSFPTTYVVSKNHVRRTTETRTILLDADGVKRLVSILSSYAMSASDTEKNTEENTEENSD